MVEQKGPWQGVPLNSEHGDANQIGSNLAEMVVCAVATVATGSQFQPNLPTQTWDWTQATENVTFGCFELDFDYVWVGIWYDWLDWGVCADLFWNLGIEYIDPEKR